MHFFIRRITFAWNFKRFKCFLRNHSKTCFLALQLIDANNEIRSACTLFVDSFPRKGRFVKLVQIATEPKIFFKLLLNQEMLTQYQLNQIPFNNPQWRINYHNLPMSLCNCARAFQFRPNQRVGVQSSLRQSHYSRGSLARQFRFGTTL